MSPVRPPWPAAGACFLAVLLGFCLPAQAGLPEPGARIFGSIALDGVVVTSANTSVIVEARRTPDGPPVASYQMGSQPNAGNFYSLKVHAENLGPLLNPEHVLLGSTLHLVVRDPSGVRDRKTFTLASRGLSARVDFGAVDTDGDGMSDAFELAYFGNATSGDPNADPDLDGRPNRREFLQGTHPNVADGRHPADLAPADDRLALNEVTDYILAWKTGGTWPVEPALTAPNIVDYVTRAGALWKGGETYVFDNTPPTNAPMWWVNVATPAAPALAGTEGTAEAADDPPAGTKRGLTLMSVATKPHAERSLPASYQPNQPLAVVIAAMPVESTRAYAVVETPPAGWIIRNLSHEGRWDPVHRQIKWGPYFDQTPRRLAYDAVPGPESTGPAAFGGRASFDGHGFAASGAAQAWPLGQGPAPRLVARLGPAGLLLELQGEAGSRYEVESSDDLLTWNGGPTVTADTAGKAATQVGANGAARFFRLKPVQ